MVFTLILGTFYFLFPVLFFALGMAEGMILQEELCLKTYKDTAIVVGITAFFEILYVVTAVALWL